MVRVGFLVLFLTLEEKIVTTEYDVSCRLVKYGFYYVEACSLYTCFVESFYHKGCLLLSNTFSASIEMIVWFLSFILFNVVYHIDWLEDIEPSLHLWNNLHLFMVYDPF